MSKIAGTRTRPQNPRNAFERRNARPDRVPRNARSQPWLLLDIYITHQGRIRPLRTAGVLIRIELHHLQGVKDLLGMTP